VYKHAFLSEETDLGGEILESNLYWNLTGEKGFLGYENLKQWAEQTGKEQREGRFTGLFADPKLAGFSMEDYDPAKIDPGTFQSLRPQAGSPLIDQGLNLKALLGLDPGSRDLTGTQVPQGELYDIGAIEYQ
jgi:hypothetical protein